jgi:hypothetical protein
VYGETKALVATATSGLPVTLTASGACTLTDATLGLVLASDVGSCSVAAKQLGDSSWQASPPASVTVVIGRATGTIDSFADASFEYQPGEDNTVTLTATSKSTSPIVYKLVSGGPHCQISGSTLKQTWNFEDDPPCVIEASVGPDAHYTAASQKATFKLTPTIVFVRSVTYAVSDDGSTVSVHVIFNRPWRLRASSTCGDYQDGDDSLEKDFTLSLSQRPCRITVEPDVYDVYMKVQGKTIDVP